jgi:phospholipase/carboxylesterase
MLPQFALPGQDRMPARDLPFIHRFYTPEDPDGSVLALLHGTGGSEADLMPLGHQINPRATLLGVRGRSTEEGTVRWFRGASGGRFDQADIRAEAEAFEAFVGGAISGYGLDARRLTFVGYSNGANFLACVMRLHPQVVANAILLRSVDVLEDAPPVRLDQTRVLMISGVKDSFAAKAGALQAALEATGADVEAHLIDAGHLWTERDVELAQAWLKAGGD